MEKPVLNADGTDYIFSWHGLFRWSKSVNLIKRGFEPDRSIPSDSNSFFVTKKRGAHKIIIKYHQSAFAYTVKFMYYLMYMHILFAYMY